MGPKTFTAEKIPVSAHPSGKCRSSEVRNSYKQYLKFWFNRKLCVFSYEGDAVYVFREINHSLL